MANIYFKKFNRESRIQTSEESFKEGVVFTRAPLDSGRSRLLVNFDLTDSGDSISVRKGLRPTMLGAPVNVQGLEPTLRTDLSITQSYDAVTEDNKRYRLVVANQFKENDTQVPNTNLSEAPAELWVIKSDESSMQYPCLDEYGITTKNMYALPISHELQETPSEDPAPKSYYTFPKTAKVNGIEVPNPRAFARPVGAFWNNAYYSFNTAGKLMRSRYMPAEGSVAESYISEELTPRDISAAEASTQGFNMLRDEPFVFTDAYAIGTIQLDGILPYDADARIAVQPIINTKYNLRCSYTVQSNEKYKIVWDYRERGTETWSDLRTEEIQYNQSTTPVPGALLVTNFSSATEDIIIRVRAYKWSGSAYSNDPEKTLAVGIHFERNTIENAVNNDLVNYDLTKATGLTYWHNCLWLYGLAQDPTVLFCSAPNDPVYFPYPHNADVFDEPIISCTPFNDNLLVFTRSQLIQLTLSSEGGWTKKVLQSNLDFSDLDARFIQVIKNMVFFKSGDYFYMIVPKQLSLQNELAVAPVSKNIEYFLDDFAENAKNLFEVLYDYSGTLELVTHYNYLNYEDVHNVYTFKTDSGLLLNLVLLYNTVDRTWRIYTYESQAPYYPLKQDATKASVLMAPAYLQFKVDDAEPVAEVGVQFLEPSRETPQDLYIPSGTILYKNSGIWVADAGLMQRAYEALHRFKNWQILDTGYRNTAIDYNKRYRELQFKINNVSHAALRFMTEFILDGETRISPYQYHTEHVIDPSSPSYGNIVISRTPVENLAVPGTTMLGEDPEDINAWTLSNSRFPEISYWKARFPVSGKGYTPRVRLVGRTEEKYELLGYTWVYRQLYSR